MQFTDQTNLIITLATTNLSYRGSATALLGMHQHLDQIVVGNEIIEQFTFSVLTGLNPPPAEPVNFVYMAPPLANGRHALDSLDLHYAAQQAVTNCVEHAIGRLLSKHGFLEETHLPAATPPVLQ